MKRKIILILSIIFQIQSYSQDSLYHYLEIAVKKNPLILQKYAEYEASLQKIPQVGSLPDPELSAGIFLSPMELMEGRQIADFRLMQMFPWFGTLKYAKDEMSLMAQAKFEIFRDTKLQVLFEVQQSWYELQRLQYNLNISRQSMEILKTLERLTLVKYKTGTISESMKNSSSSSMPQSSSNNAISTGMSGMGNSMAVPGNTAQVMPQENQPMPEANTSMGLTELYRIQIEYANLENTILLLQNKLVTETARLNSYLNRSTIIQITLPSQLTIDSSGMKLQLLSDTIIMGNPMLSMLNYEQKSLESKTKMIKRMGYPMVGLGVNYALINKNPMLSSSMNGKDMVMPMVSLTLPIYRRKYKAMQKEAELLKSATAENYISTSNTLKINYHEAMQQLQDAYRRLNLYTNNVKLLKQSLELTLKSFSTSGSGLTDILQVQQQLLDYESKKAEAITEYNTTVAYLKRLGAWEVTL